MGPAARKMWGFPTGQPMPSDSQPHPNQPHPQMQPWLFPQAYQGFVPQQMMVMGMMPPPAVPPLTAGGKKKRKKRKESKV